MTTGAGPSEWDLLARWWIDDGSRDPLYRYDVLPWLRDIVEPLSGTLLDLGCGEGQAMRALDRHVVGCDLTMELLHQARAAGPVVCARLPHLPWIRDDALGGAFAVFVLEHLDDVDRLFVEAARAVRPGGGLAVIANHPAYTAPGAGPLMDERDGEVLWRWGPYFSEAVSLEPVPGGHVTFHHRPLSSIVNAAAVAGWSLTSLEERGLSAETTGANPSLVGQEHMPRMIGLRWRRD